MTPPRTPEDTSAQTANIPHKRTRTISGTERRTRPKMPDVQMTDQMDYTYVPSQYDEPQVHEGPTGSHLISNSDGLHQNEPQPIPMQQQWPTNLAQQHGQPSQPHPHERTVPPMGLVDSEQQQVIMGPVDPLPSLENSTKRMCPFAFYDSKRYNKREWSQCWHQHEKNGDIVVHLGRHHRLIRSRRAQDEKSHRKNTHGQSYIAICSQDNFFDRGESQCKDCAIFDSVALNEASSSTDPNHRISAVCQKCWSVIGSREALVSHLGQSCGGRAPKHTEKWNLELEAFCQLPDWIVPMGPTPTQQPNPHPPDETGDEIMPTSLSTTNRNIRGSDSMIAAPPDMTMTTAPDVSLQNQLYDEIDKLRFHLWYICNHPEAGFSQQIHNWYRLPMDNLLTPRGGTNARYGPPLIPWPYTTYPATHVHHEHTQHAPVHDQHPPIHDPYMAPHPQYDPNMHHHH